MIRIRPYRRAVLLLIIVLILCSAGLPHNSSVMSYALRPAASTNSFMPGTPNLVTASEIESFALSINGLIQDALMEGTKIEIEGKEAQYQYPFMCVAAAEVARVMLKRKFGNRLKAIDLVLGEPITPIHLDKRAIMDRHAWVEILTHDGRRYYLSFVDGQFDIGSYWNTRWFSRKIIRIVAGIKVVKREFVDWYRNRGHGYVTFIDVTEDSAYQAQLDKLRMRVSARGAEIWKRAAVYGWADKVLSYIDRAQPPVIPAMGGNVATEIASSLMGWWLKGLARQGRIYDITASSVSFIDDSCKRLSGYFESNMPFEKYGPARLRLLPVDPLSKYRKIRVLLVYTDPEKTKDKGILGGRVAVCDYKNNILYVDAIAYNLFSPAARKGLYDHEICEFALADGFEVAKEAQARIYSEFLREGRGHVYGNLGTEILNDIGISVPVSGNDPRYMVRDQDTCANLSHHQVARIIERLEAAIYDRQEMPAERGEAMYIEGQRTSIVKAGTATTDWLRFHRVYCLDRMGMAEQVEPTERALYNVLESMRRESGESPVEDFDTWLYERLLSFPRVLSEAIPPFSETQPFISAMGGRRVAGSAADGVTTNQRTEAQMHLALGQMHFAENNFRDAQIEFTLAVAWAHLEPDQADGNIKVETIQKARQGMRKSQDELIGTLTTPEEVRARLASINEALEDRILDITATWLLELGRKPTSLDYRRVKSKLLKYCRQQIKPVLQAEVLTEGKSNTLRKETMQLQFVLMQRIDKFIQELQGLADQIKLDEIIYDRPGAMLEWHEVVVTQLVHLISEGSFSEITASGKEQIKQAMIRLGCPEKVIREFEAYSVYVYDTDEPTFKTAQTTFISFGPEQKAIHITLSEWLRLSSINDMAAIAARCAQQMYEVLELKKLAGKDVDMQKWFRSVLTGEYDRAAEFVRAAHHANRLSIGLEIAVLREALKGLSSSSYAPRQQDRIRRSINSLIEEYDRLTSRFEITAPVSFSAIDLNVYPGRNASQASNLRPPARSLTPAYKITNIIDTAA